MLHAMIGQPQEFKLTVNLRSPRRIADVVNRVWDLYDYLHKQDRPSGTGYAEIDDDGPDQILYVAVPQAELAPLLRSLSAREGLALIAFDKTNLPSDILPFVLSPAEAKGLDFHSVCMLNGGSLLRRIVDDRASAAADMLARRLAIDQLRVALSRPSERLFWVDAAPNAATVREVGHLLRPAADVALHPITAEALRTSLEEEELDVEDRLQRCEKDARQLVSVKPDLAWSRARQAVALLGLPGDINCYGPGGSRCRAPDAGGGLFSARVPKQEPVARARPAGSLCCHRTSYRTCRAQFSARTTAAPYGAALRAFWSRGSHSTSDVAAHW